MSALVRLGRKSLLYQNLFSESVLRCFSAKAHPRFIPSRLGEAEHVDSEDYQPGGLHSISIGDTFAKGHYRITHKLGFCGSSTIWMARDHQQDSPRGNLITLKAMRADVSSKAADDFPEVFVPRMCHVAGIPSSDFQTVEDHFIVQVPNGSHRFLVSPFAGPSILAMSDCPGSVSGSRRLPGTWPGRWRNKR